MIVCLILWCLGGGCFGGFGLVYGGLRLVCLIWYSFRVADLFAVTHSWCFGFDGVVPAVWLGLAGLGFVVVGLLRLCCFGVLLV